MDTQEFWKGDFGNEYTERNVGLEENNYEMFYKIFLPDYSIINYHDIKSIIEFGAGSGQNIKALKRIFPDAKYTAVEINESACEELSKIDNLIVWNQDINRPIIQNKYDLVLTKGVLIHIPPDRIQETYRRVYKASQKYILICEYYNPVEVEIPYRGNAGKLWKRPDAENMMKMFSDLSIVDYGFVSKLDKYKQDDITWFLLQKNTDIDVHKEMSI